MKVVIVGGVADSAERLPLRRPVNKSFCYLPSRNLHIF